MRQFLFLILAFTLPLAHAEIPKLHAIKGEKYADQWRGNYKVTKCIICEDVPLDYDVNLKNLVEFGIDFAIIPPKDLPQCADTQLSVAHYFAVTSDDGRNTSVLIKHFGMCEWRVSKNFQFLDISDDYIHNRKIVRNTDNVILEEDMLTIDKIGDNKFLIHRIIQTQESVNGLPTKYVYLFEAKKVAATPKSSSQKSVQSTELLEKRL